MIGGFILGGGGGGSSTVIVRGIGPSLTSSDLSDVLADPVLELHDSNGDVIDSNDNWMDNPNMQLISDAGLAPTDPKESALYEILPAGEYTAILSGVGNTTGIGWSTPMMSIRRSRHQLDSSCPKKRQRRQSSRPTGTSRPGDLLLSQ